MTYNDERERTSRVIVNTPTSRREVIQTETAEIPERSGISNGVVAALVVGAVALVTILFLFLLKNQQDIANDESRTATTQPATTQQQQPPIIVQQPAAAQPPVYVQQPAAPSSAPIVIEKPSGPDDLTIQSNIDKKIAEDTRLAAQSVTVLVSNSKATLTGTVDSEALKSRAERLVLAVKGVQGVDNQIVVLSQ